MASSHRRRPLAALGVALLVLLAATVATAPPASACSCALPYGADDEAFDLADVVFVGELRSTDRPVLGGSDDPATLWFDVSEVYRGEAFTSQPVSSPQSSASCGLELTAEDGPYLVFAGRADDDAGDDPADQRLTAHLCGGTRPADYQAIPAGWTAEAPLVGTGRAPDSSSSPLIALVAVGVVGASGLALVGAVWWRRRRS